MIHWGHRHSLPHLDLQVDISTVQLVGPCTSREEFRDLYYQVYKLSRLPRSLLCGPEWAGELTRDVVSSLKNCLRQKEDELLRGQGESEFADTQPMQNMTPWRGRQGTSAENELNEAREAHWRALATTVVLEEKIERLSWSITRGCLNACAHSWSHNWWSRRSQGWSRRCHRALLEGSPAHSSMHSPPQWEDEEAEPPFLEFNLGSPPELGPDVEHFFQDPADECGEDGGSHFPAEPPAEEYERWVEWRAWTVDTPS